MARVPPQQGGLEFKLDIYPMNYDQHSKLLLLYYPRGARFLFIIYIIVSIIRQSRRRRMVVLLRNIGIILGALLFSMLNNYVYLPSIHVNVVVSSYRQLPNKTVEEFNLIILSIP